MVENVLRSVDDMVKESVSKRKQIEEVVDVEIEADNKYGSNRCRN